MNNSETKTCSRCKQELRISFFNKKKIRKDKSILYQQFCKECNKKSSREYYAKNKEKHRKEIYKRREKYKESARKYIWSILTKSKCLDCNEDDPVVLEFDHIDASNKKHCISSMIQGRFSLNAIKEEINKCEIRCANCHRRKSAINGEYYRAKYAGLI